MLNIIDSTLNLISIKIPVIITYEIPYENAKEMLLVEEVDNKDFLTGLFDVMYDELPTPKPKKKK